MAVRNLVFLQNLFSEPKAFGTAIFWACCAGCPKPVFVKCFWVFRATNLRFVSRGGGVPMRGICIPSIIGIALLP